MLAIGRSAARLDPFRLIGAAGVVTLLLAATIRLQRHPGTVSEPDRLPGDATKLPSVL
jgi:hypothetical protein